MTSSAIVKQYVDALHHFDLDALQDLIHPDITVRYPQSGEVIRGAATYVEMLRNYPGAEAVAEIDGTVGADEQVQVSSPLPFGLPSVTVSTASDTFTCKTVVTYPDGSIWHVVFILRFLNGKIIEETSYFGEPFDPPDWRAPYRDEP